MRDVKGRCREVYSKSVGRCRGCRGKVFKTRKEKAENKEVIKKRVGIKVFQLGNTRKLCVYVLRHATYFHVSGEDWPRGVTEKG